VADNNKLELVVEVDVNKANASIKSINTGLSSMEQAAGKAARGASAGIDGIRPQRHHLYPTTSAHKRSRMVKILKRSEWCRRLFETFPYLTADDSFRPGSIHHITRPPVRMLPAFRMHATCSIQLTTGWASSAQKRLSYALICA
jgi:hypothetical protein